MKGAQAIDQLDPQKWATTTVVERLHLLEEVRENMKTYAEELAASDTKMKNGIMGEDLFFETGRAGPAAELAPGGDDAVTGDEERGPVFFHGPSHGALSPGVTGAHGQLLIGDGLARGNGHECPVNISHERCGV